MNVTLQPYVQPYVLSGSTDFIQLNRSIHNKNHSANYLGKINMLSNNVLHMVNEAEERFGRNVTEQEININNKTFNRKEKIKRHISDLREKSINANPNQARLGCFDHEEKRVSLPESTVDVDIEYLDPQTVTRSIINDKNQDGLTPLMRIALTGGDSKDIRSLIRQGAKVDLQDNAGNTALMWVVKSLFRLENEKRIQVKLKILDVLINRDANLDLADMEGFTPLMIAAMGDDKNSFKKLFINKAMVELKNNDGQTALHLAVKYNASKSIVDQLGLFYQKMNVNDANGHTPFMIATFYGRLDFMDSFFSKGLVVDHVDVRGWTALMHAVNCSKEEVVNKLCSYGANVILMTVSRKSALVIAFENKDKMMAATLIKAGAVATSEEIKHWLKEVLKDNVITNDSTGRVIAKDNIAYTGGNVINVSDRKEAAIAVTPILEYDLNGDKEAKSNSSNSSGSSYSIPQWIVYKLRSFYEAFRRYASPIPPL